MDQRGATVSTALSTTALMRIPQYTIGALKIRGSPTTDEQRAYRP